jgi:hypothetical protein
MKKDTNSQAKQKSIAASRSAVSERSSLLLELSLPVTQATGSKARRIFIKRMANMIEYRFSDED